MRESETNQPSSETSSFLVVSTRYNMEYWGDSWDHSVHHSYGLPGLPLTVFPTSRFRTFPSRYQAGRLSSLALNIDPSANANQKQGKQREVERVTPAYLPIQNQRGEGDRWTGGITNTRGGETGTESEMNVGSMNSHRQ